MIRIMLFRVIAILAAIPLVGEFSNAQDPTLSPVPLAALPATFSLSDSKRVLAHQLNDAKPLELSEARALLEPVQEKTRADLKHFSGRAWRNRIDEGSKQGTVILAEFAWLADGNLRKEVHSFLRRDLRTPDVAERQSQGGFTTDSFDQTFAIVRTPNLSLEASNYEIVKSGGFTDVELQRPREDSSPAGFCFDELFFHKMGTPGEFWERISADVESGRYEAKCESNDSELVVRITKTGEQYPITRTWCFDRKSGCVVRYHYDWIAQDIVVEIHYQTVDNTVVPAGYELTNVNRQAAKWYSVEQVTFFDLSIEVLKADDFALATLDIDPGLRYVRDIRQGGMVKLPLDEVIVK